MILLKIKNIQIKFDISMILLCVLWIVAGNVKTLFTMLFVVLIHESAHAITAKLLGLETQSVTLNLFGGTAQIKGIEEDQIKEGIIALMGPLVSVFSGFMWQQGANLGVIPLWQEFIEYSYSIALINLLPIYPLDGGRILFCIFKSIFGFKKSKKITVLIGIILSTGILIKNIITLVLWGRASGIIMALFMFAASLKAIKTPRIIGVRENLWESTENIKIIKAYDNESLLNISKKFFGMYFYMVAVFDEKHQLIGFLTEKQINDRLMQKSVQTLKEAVIHHNKQAHL